MANTGGTISATTNNKPASTAAPGPGASAAAA
jgi:hypothetical protein